MLKNNDELNIKKGDVTIFAPIELSFFFFSGDRVAKSAKMNDWNIYQKKEEAYVTLNKTHNCYNIKVEFSFTID